MVATVFKILTVICDITVTHSLCLASVFIAVVSFILFRPQISVRDSCKLKVINKCNFFELLSNVQYMIPFPPTLGNYPFPSGDFVEASAMAVENLGKYVSLPSLDFPVLTSFVVQ